MAITSTVVVSAGLLTLWAAGAASAHVTVAAPGVTVGASDAAITFRAPDESSTASTVGLTVQLPVDTPMAGVLVVPTPGWTVTITNKTLTTPIKTDDGDITEVVSQIDWKATAGAGIKPGYVGQFGIVAGKLPDDTKSLVFKAIQLYSDGTTVNWIETPAPGSTTEPEHPAPTLDLTAAATTSPTAVVTEKATTAAGASKASATTGIVLGAIGVVLGAAALGLSLLRRRSS